MRRLACILSLTLIFCAAAPRDGQAQAGETRLASLVERARQIRPAGRTAEAYREAAERWRSLIADLEGIDRASLGLDDQVDYDLLRAHARTEVFELDEIKLHEVNPIRYFALGATNRLFLRPGALGDPAVRAAIRELKALPDAFAAGKALLKRPARTWTENAIYQAHYARVLLDEYVPQAVVSEPALKQELLAAAADARGAVDDFARWLERDLLPRSTRSPAWTPKEIEFYQFVHEQLDDYGVDRMLEIAEAEDAELMSEMRALAKQIHPSGDLKTVWEVRKEEAPPWEGVIPMSQDYVDRASAWLRGDGDHVVTIPDYIDYGAALSPPMARRTLSFGGATGGPTVAGRQSGYYILTPLESILTPEEKASRIKSYNPYWTHVISYHEWLGHNVQIAAANEHVTRPMRRMFRSSYFSQAWSFYLEKLLEDEGYYETLPYMERLKTRMARRQMRMWRVQRILTKLKMAKGEMTFDQAIQAYIDRIGMEPTNAFIEVQRDSQSPAPPGREIIGERVILDLREEYQRRMGRHYTLKRFNDTLLTYGDLPFAQIRRLMFRE